MSVTDMTNEEVKRDALSWVNAFRTEHGLEPLKRLPQGFRKSSWHCVLGEATGMCFDLSSIASLPYTLENRVDDSWLSLPPVVQELEQRFECGQMPELRRLRAKPCGQSDEPLLTGRRLRLARRRTEALRNQIRTRSRT